MNNGEKNPNKKIHITKIRSQRKQWIKMENASSCFVC